MPETTKPIRPPCANCGHRAEDHWHLSGGSCDRYVPDGKGGGRPTCRCPGYAPRAAPAARAATGEE